MCVCVYVCERECVYLCVCVRSVRLSLTQYLEASGLHDPLSKIYVTCEPQPHIALWLSVAIMQQMHRFSYDRDYGAVTVVSAVVCAA